MGEGERRGEGAGPESPTSPGGYYFDDDEDAEGDAEGTSSRFSVNTLGASLNDATSAISTNANKLVGSLADGFSRFRFRASEPSSRAGVRRKRGAQLPEKAGCPRAPGCAL